MQNHYDYDKKKLPMLVAVLDTLNEPIKFRETVLMLENVIITSLILIP